MVFNTTFNNIPVVSWRSVLLMEETGENHRPVANHRQTITYNVVSSTPSLSGIGTHNVCGDSRFKYFSTNEMQPTFISIAYLYLYGF